MAPGYAEKSGLSAYRDPLKSSKLRVVSLKTGKLYTNYIVAKDAEGLSDLMSFRDAQELASIFEFNRDSPAYKVWEGRIGPFMVLGQKPKEERTIEVANK